MLHRVVIATELYLPLIDDTVIVFGDEYVSPSLLMQLLHLLPVVTNDEGRDRVGYGDEGMRTWEGIHFQLLLHLLTLLLMVEKGFSLLFHRHVMHLGCVPRLMLGQKLGLHLGGGLLLEGMALVCNLTSLLYF